MLFFLTGLVIGIISFVFTRRIVLSILMFVFNWWATWQFLPVINFHFFGWPFLIMVDGFAILFWELMISDIRNKEKRKSSVISALAFLVVGVFWVAIIPMFTSWGILHARAYRDLIGEVREGVFSADTTPVDTTQVRTVDQLLAGRLADKRLGEDMALGSQVNVGTMRIQQVNGLLYWVGSLDHSGFWKWWLNSKGTPGYIMVSATNERDVKLVQEVNGEKVFLKYNAGCYFDNRILRYLYKNGYATKGLIDFTFEIDDDGYPYWVITQYQKRVGFFGEDAVGVVLVNAQNGKIDEYSIENAPTWIDRIQPENIIITQLNNWGEYVHGWPNWSGKDKLKTTEGTSLVYGADGKSYWYTGVTSIGADEGTVGFVLVNTRTKEATMYNQAGATETAAMGSAEGAVQEKGYKATFPILYNISGVPTYFTTLKDDAGLVKSMAWVSVEDYNIVGIGATITEALRNYRRNLVTRGNDIAPDSLVNRLVANGEVLRIGKDDSNYYFLIRGYEQKLFVGSLDLSLEIVITKVGDLITVEYNEGGSEIVDIVEFDNTTIELQKIEAQKIVEGRSEEIREKEIQ
ncbi:MAG: hypothetical protein ABIC36_01335 [bacterium]